MLKSECYVGQQVYFGRPNGEKTLGKIVRINQKTASVDALEGRGSREDGGKWLVGFSLLTAHLPNNVADSPDRFAQLKDGGPIAYDPFNVIDNVILSSIADCYNGLSPENLYADGERSREEAQARARTIQSELKKLQCQLGRLVSEDQAFDWQMSRLECRRGKLTKSESFQPIPADC